MPAKARWLVRIPEIIATLKALPCPVVDRALIEIVFAVGRRQAIHLLNRFGGYQVGRTFVADRLALIECLQRLDHAPDCHYERVRRRRFAEQLELLHLEAGAKRVRLPVASLPDESLPAGVWFESGRLVVDFDSAEDLLGKLYEIARQAAEDVERFRKRLGGIVRR